MQALFSSDYSGITLAFIRRSTVQCLKEDGCGGDFFILLLQAAIAVEKLYRYDKTCLHHPSLHWFYLNLTAGACSNKKKCLSVSRALYLVDKRGGYITFINYKASLSLGSVVIH